LDQPIEFLHGQPARLLWRSAARKITAVDVHKQDSFADEVINTELDKVLDQGKDIATALADAQRLLERRAHR
jgi:multiple sugar transport system substrate-binding protein